MFVDVVGVRSVLLFSVSIFLFFFSVFVFGVTMSDEGGLEEVAEFFLRMAISVLSRSISSRASLSSVSSSAIRLSLPSMMLRILFFPVDKSPILGKIKKIP